MAPQYDFKKEWEKTRLQLTKLSKDAVEAAKKGEKELVKLSKKSKLHVDSTALSLKREQLFYLIGKEYAGIKVKSKSSTKLTKLMSELDKTEKHQKTLKRKINSKK